MVGGLGATPVGTVVQVADVFEQWMTEADVDGFNIVSTSLRTNSSISTNWLSGIRDPAKVVRRRCRTADTRVAKARAVLG